MTATPEMPTETMDMVTFDAETLQPEAPTTALISEQEIMFSNAAAAAAATSISPATTRRHWRRTTVFAAIGRIHIRLPEPRPCYPRLDGNYFEDARLSRQMDHL